MAPVIQMPGNNAIINLEQRGIQFLPYMDKIATISNLGVDVLSLFGYKSKYIPHIVEEKDYFFMNKKEELRNEYDIPGIHLYV